MYISSLDYISKKMCTIKMRLIFLIIVLTKFSLFANVGEIVLTCKMNYGISGENDEADIEFKI